MELTAYLRILRQRWRLLLAPVIAALAVAALTLPGTPSDTSTTPVAESYTATATLISEPPATEDAYLNTSLAVVGLYATIGEVPQRAARLLDYEGEPQMLAALVTVTPQEATGTLNITTTDPDAQVAAARVNAFSRALVEFFRDRQEADDEARATALRRQVAALTRDLQEAQAQTIGGTNVVAESRVSSLQTQLTNSDLELAEITSGPAARDLLTVLQPGVAIPQGAGSPQAIAAPGNPLLRVGVAALLGLLLGAALALVVERLDSRMRTREQAEEAMGLPVLAEVPLMPKGQREGIASADRPASGVAEAFRGLRSSVLLLSPSLGRRTTTGHREGSLVVMVTSALPGAGKTTTAANLAAVMAEAGRSVLVLSLDLRNPTVHQHFAVPNRTGISELLSADRGKHLDQVVHDTSVGGVRIATSGHDTDHPGALLASVGALIEAARSLAEVVIIDAPPMLTVSDALDLAPHADVTLLVSRLNKTTRAQAEECQRLFKRLGVSALGTVLVGSRPAGARYGYAVMAPPAEQSTADQESPALARDER